MADGIEAKLTGFDEIQKKLEPFTKNSLAMRRILTRASRLSMADTRKKARANAKKLDRKSSPRKIWKNVATTVNSKHFLAKGYVVAKVGIRGGAKKGGTAAGGDTYYWRFLEFGTAKMAARPFLRPAFDPEKIQAEFAKNVDEAIAKEVKKHGTPT